MTNIRKYQALSGDVTNELSQLWLPTNRIAELVEKSEQSIRKACVERNGKYRGGVYVFRKKGRNYEIALSSIPNIAQNKYINKHLDAIEPLQSTALTVKSNNQALDFNAYNAMAQSYASKPTSIQLEAEKRLKVLDEFNELLALNTSKGAAEKLIKSRYSDVSKPTLWRWRNLVAGQDRAYWIYLLAPNYEGRQKQTIPQDAWDYFVSLHDQAQAPHSVCYYTMQQANKAQLWGALPSLKTFIRRYEALPQNFRIFIQQGVTALKESLPSIKRDYTTLAIHELWEADGRKADVNCRWQDGEVSRPWIVTMRDVRTRMVLARLISKTNDKALVLEAFKQACELTKTHPIGFLFDNGTEYSCICLTGGQLSNVRHRSDGHQPLGILTRMGITIHWATPYHGAAKPIESFWNIIAKYADKTCGKAYVGNNPVNRPEDADPKHAIPIEEYANLLKLTISAWCNGEFGKHRGHGMQGKSPLELYNELMPAHLAKQATAEELNSMRDVIFTRTLSRQCTFSFTLSGYGKVEYEAANNDALVRGCRYDLLPNISDPTAPALIYDGSKYLGEALYKAHMPFFSLADESKPSPNQLRASEIKKQRAAQKAISQRVKGIKPALSNTVMTLAMPTQHDIIKLPTVKHVPAESPITTLSDGTLVNNQSGDRVSLVKHEPMPLLENNAHQKDLDELEEKRKNKAYLEASDYIKEAIDPQRYAAEQAVAKENAHPENARLNNK